MTRNTDMPQSRYEQLDESIRKVLAQVGEIKTSVAVLSEHVAGIDSSMASQVAHIKEQNGRVRKLEVWRGWIAGAIAVGGTALGALGKMVIDHVTKH